MHKCSFHLDYWASASYHRCNLIVFRVCNAYQVFSQLEYDLSIWQLRSMTDVPHRKRRLESKMKVPSCIFIVTLKALRRPESHTGLPAGTRLANHFDNTPFVIGCKALHLVGIYFIPVT